MWWRVGSKLVPSFVSPTKAKRLSRRWLKATVELNRLGSTKQALAHQGKLTDKSVRRARTRTLIQIGALVKMVGLFSVCGIEEGMDLQLNIEHQDKAAILLGVLLQAYEALPDKPSVEQLDRWKNQGIQKFKSHQADKHYN